MTEKWWQKAIVYQVYPRSFYDSNNDGIGDIQGIIEKLDYIADLGVNMIWMNPIFMSPNDDNGYDISDFYAISPEFGTMADVEALIDEAHKRGIRVMFDLVMNHTSDEHPWFIESRSSKDNPYRDFYIWADGRKAENGTGTVEPTNWEGFFGGSVWEKDEQTDQYYMHLFSKKMPDLNWQNKSVREAIYDIARFWADKGIDGFRVDAIIHIGKDLTLPQGENDGSRAYVLADKYYANLPVVHDYVHEFHKEVLGPMQIMTVGEGSTAGIDEAKKYTAPEREEFDMLITFEHLSLDYDYSVTHVPPKWTHKKLDLLEFKSAMRRWQDGLYGHGWNTLYWNNHDMPRVVSRFGNSGVYREESAKMLATLMYLQWGTPYILQGEELGMTNAEYEDLSDYRDVEVFTLYNETVVKGGHSHDEVMAMIHNRCRDNSRTPMQWSAEKYAGFSKHEPWMKVSQNYLKINVEQQQNDPNSVLNYFKKLLRLRQSHDVFIYGTFQFVLEDDPNIYAYIREYEGEKMLVVCNFSGAERAIQLDVPKGELLLANYVDKNDDDLTILRPYEARVYQF